MPRQNAPIIAFNRGVISKLALSRIDIDKVRWSAEKQTNWMPRSLGSMMLRPGMEHIAQTANQDKAFYIPFIFSTTDTARVEFTDTQMRIQDYLIQSSSGTMTNETFDTDLTGWSDNDESGATSAWATGGYMSLTGTGANRAIRRQTVSGMASAGGFKVIVERGKVRLRVGSTSGGNEYIEADLEKGEYIFSNWTNDAADILIPLSATFHVELSAIEKYASLVNSCSMLVGSGINGSPSASNEHFSSEYVEADLTKIRYEQSADVIFIACSGYKQKKIERRASYNASGSAFYHWGFVDYLSVDGPFSTINISQTTITCSALSGDITVTSSQDLFSSDDVDGLFRVDSTGQSVSQSVSGEGQWTGDILVSGLSRGFAVSVSGTFVATVTLQSSIGVTGSWEDVETYTVPTAKTFNDGLTNQDVYYRIGVDTGDYTSGTAEVSLTYGGGTIKGIFQVTGYTSATSVSAIVIKEMGSTDAELDWYEGLWSDRNGFPSTVSLYEGRLWWSGNSRIWGSVSDQYYNYDIDVVGDSAAINRIIAFGASADAYWTVALNNLLIGSSGAEITVRSTDFNEVVTPTNFNMKAATTQGSDNVDAATIDQRGFFVQKSGQRLLELFQGEQAFSYYSARDTTLLVPDLLSAGVERIVVQRQPDTRVHCVLSDGTVALLLTDPAEEIEAWIKIETTGVIEDAFVLPGSEEDEVFYVVNRQVNGADNRALEKWAKESDCRGTLVGGYARSRCLDRFYTKVDSAGFTSLPNVFAGIYGVGATVSCWADGKDIGTFTVNGSGGIDLGATYHDVMVGHTYNADYKSTKLAYAAGMGTALNQRKRISGLGLIMADTHAQGLKYGSDENNLDNLPLVEADEDVDVDSIWDEYDYDAVEFNGEWDTDSRLYLRAAAPRPCTVLSAVLQMQTKDKS